jgi:hypothetical protein
MPGMPCGVSSRKPFWRHPVRDRTRVASAMRLIRAAPLRDSRPPILDFPTGRNPGVFNPPDRRPSIYPAAGL